MDESKEDTGESARKKTRSSGSETLTYLKEKIEKETRLKEQEVELRKQELELQERRLQIAQDSKSNF